MFARQTQLILLDEAGNRTELTSPSSAGSNATTPDDSGAARARSRLNRYSFTLDVTSLLQLRNMFVSQKEKFLRDVMHIIIFSIETDAIVNIINTKSC